MLSDRDVISDLRSRSGIPLSVGDLSSPVGRFWFGADGHFPCHSDGRLCLHVEKGRPGLGLIQMAETNSQISVVEGKLGSKVIETLQPQGDDVLILDRSDLRESFRILKEDPELDFAFLSDITAVDSSAGAGKRSGRGITHAALARREFHGARSLGSFRHPFYRSSGFAAHS